MRNFRIKYFCLLLIAAISLSCANNGSKINTLESETNVGQIGPEPRIVTGVAKREIFSEVRFDTSEFVINYSYFSRQNSSNVMDSLYKDSVNFIIYSQTIYNRSGLVSRNNIEAITRSFFTAQLDSLAEEFYYDLEGDEDASLWDMETTIGIKDYPSFVELSLSGWGYMGGAHGYYFDEYIMINRENGRKLGLLDFFVDRDELNKIAEPYFRDLAGMSPTDSYGDSDFWFTDDKFTVNENFTFTEGGVIFYYNVYEIGPYVLGPTELLIPLDKIQHLIKLEL